jgi:large conductance mechanosensitive channel
MPGEGGYQSWSFVLAGKEVPYGLFLGEVVNFLVVAFALFLLVAKVIGPMVKARQEPPPPPAAPAPTKDQELLAEIRDLLRARQNV